MTKVIIIGSQGRMGQALGKVARESGQYEVVGEIKHGDDIFERINRTDAIIDFSHHSASGVVARAATDYNKALVMGTTGHSPAELQEITTASARIPLVLAPNFSVGVNLLFHLTRRAAEILGNDYDQEVVEMHHRMKLDAPSGTAARLAGILTEVKNKPCAELVKNGRVGETGLRTRDEIGVHAIRGGDVMGDHDVIFAGPGERVVLTHKASSRDTFASGALRAAAWAVGRTPGLYSMQDVLALR